MNQTQGESFTAEATSACRGRGHRQPFTLPARLILAGLMVIGRLEIVPTLLMFAAPWHRL